MWKFLAGVWLGSALSGRDSAPIGGDDNGGSGGGGCALGCLFLVVCCILLALACYLVVSCVGATSGA